MTVRFAVHGGAVAYIQQGLQDIRAILEQISRQGKAYLHQLATALTP